MSPPSSPGSCSSTTITKPTRNIKEAARALARSTQHEEQYRFSCPKCFRTFLTPQALGGHQNAHRAERSDLMRELRERSNLCRRYTPYTTTPARMRNYVRFAVPRLQYGPMAGINQGTGSEFAHAFRPMPLRWYPQDARFTTGERVAKNGVIGGSGSHFMQPMNFFPPHDPNHPVRRRDMKPLHAGESSGGNYRDANNLSDAVVTSLELGVGGCRSVDTGVEMNPRELDLSLQL